MTLLLYHWCVRLVCLNNQSIIPFVLQAGIQCVAPRSSISVPDRPEEFASLVEEEHTLLLYTLCAQHSLLFLNCNFVWQWKILLNIRQHAKHCSVGHPRARPADRRIWLFSLVFSLAVFFTPMYMGLTGVWRSLDRDRLVCGVQDGVGSPFLWPPHYCSFSGSPAGRGKLGHACGRCIGARDVCGRE